MSKINPMSKEFQDEATRLGLTGNQLIQKNINEKKLPNPIDINRTNHSNVYEKAGCRNATEYHNKCAQKAGYKDSAHYMREWRYDNGIQLPLSVNEDCAHYLGTFIAERQYGRIILPEMFGGIQQEMPYGNPKFDFIVTDNIKIDIKSCCLREVKGWIGWEPHVRYNKDTDYFVILAFDNRADLNIFHIWSIGRYEMIRGDKFYNRYSIKITNRYRYLLEFKRFDLIDKLQCLKNMR